MWSCMALISKLLGLVVYPPSVCWNSKRIFHLILEVNNYTERWAFTLYGTKEREQGLGIKITQGLLNASWISSTIIFLAPENRWTCRLRLPILSKRRFGEVLIEPIITFMVTLNQIWNPHLAKISSQLAIKPLSQVPSPIGC